MDRNGDCEGMNVTKSVERVSNYLFAIANRRERERETLAVLYAFFSKFLPRSKKNTLFLKNTVLRRSNISKRKKRDRRKEKRNLF